MFPELRGHHSLFTVHVLERQIHTIILMFTIRYLNSRANDSLIAAITFTYSLQSRE